MIQISTNRNKLKIEKKGAKSTDIFRIQMVSQKVQNEEDFLYNRRKKIG